MPGRQIAAYTNIDDNGPIWVNPANTVDSSTGIELGAHSFGNVGGYRAILNLPGNLAIGYEYGEVALKNWGYPYQFHNNFQVLSLARKGFGSEGWIDKLRLGISIRYAQNLLVDNYFVENSFNYENVWAIDAGLSQDIPLPKFLGQLTVGSYFLQASNLIFGPHQLGLQMKWLNYSNYLRIDGNLTAFNPMRRQEFDFWSKNPSTFAPESRISATTILPIADIGISYLPVYNLYVPSLELKIPSWSYLQELRVGFYSALPLEHYAFVGILNMNVKLRFNNGEKREPDSTRYLQEREKRVQDYHQYLLEHSVKASATKSDSSSIILDETKWNAITDYNNERIGVWRGVVWPYVNTFGIYTTLFSPAGTSSLAVGNYNQGLLLLGGVATGFGLTFLSYSIEEQKFLDSIFSLNIVLKIVDWALARRFVKAHNRQLRLKYNITAFPISDREMQGAGLALNF